MQRNLGSTKVNRMVECSPLVLFLSSYMPLFLLIAFRQIYTNKSQMVIGGEFSSSIVNYFHYFGMATLCVFLTILGLWGTYITFKNLEAKAENGTVVRISEVSSMNDEPLAYVATYIIPILFEDYSNFVDCVSILMIMYVVYMLYIRSNLLLVNPILNLKYSIFNIKYKDGDIERQGVLISKDRYIEECDKVKIYNVGYQLFYGIKR